MDSFLVHDDYNAKHVSIRQAKNELYRQINSHCKITGMNQDRPRPYADIAERLKWHRETILALTQEEYSKTIGTKRAAYSLWEAGTHRLSLDGALALRCKYGLPMDFMYAGVDDALPMTLRNAWRERP